MDIKYKELIRQATRAQKNAYAPYSKFKVGAAVLGASGKIYQGCNIENASYGLTICAERTAIAKAISEGEKGFKAIAIHTNAQPLTPPCGACRQFIREFGADIPILLTNHKKESAAYNISDLLPHSFHPKMLKASSRKPKKKA